MPTPDGSSFFKAGSRSAPGDDLDDLSLHDLRNGLAQLREMSQRLDEAQALIQQIHGALAAGDEAQAEVKIQAAARLPFDERERRWTGTMAAYQHLWDTIDDAMESWPDIDDSSWVDVVVEHVHATTGHAERELRRVVGGIANDYFMPPADEKRLRELSIDSDRAFAPPEIPELSDRVEHIRQVASLAADLARALDEQAAKVTTRDSS